MPFGCFFCSLGHEHRIASVPYKGYNGGMGTHILMLSFFLQCVHKSFIHIEPSSGMVFWGIPINRA